MARNPIPEKYKGREIYSFSKLSSFNGCQYGYYLTYCQGKRGEDNIYSVLGKCLHEIVEKAQFNGMSNDEMLKEFNDKVFEVMEIQGYKFASEKIQTNFMESVTHYIKNYKPIDCKQFESEKEFYTEIDGNVILGYIDGVIYHHDDTIQVIDYKTSTKFTKADLDKYGLQLSLYAYALNQEYGIKIDRISWIMAKYCNISWEGATKPRQAFVLRNEIVKYLRSELKKDLRKFGKEDVEIEIILDDAQLKNDMTLLPQSIQDKYVITDGVVDYEISERTEKLLIDFVVNTVKEIESRSKTDESQWQPKDIDKSGSFFCGTLCNAKATCKHYKDWMQSNSSTIEFCKPSDDGMKELFG